MGSLSKDIISKLDDRNKSLEKLVGNLGNLMSMVSEVMSGIGAAKAVLGALGFFGSEKSVGEQLEELRRLMEREFGELHREIYGLSQGSRMIAIDHVLSKARARLQELHENDLDQLDHGRGEPWYVDTHDAVEELRGRALWVRPYFEDLTYDSPWGGKMRPPGEGNELVFDFAVTLPGYLEAVTIRLAVLAMMVPDFRVSHRPELEDMRKKLADVAYEISSGIRQLSLPSPDELETKVPMGVLPPAWTEAGRPAGGVETYTASASVVPWPTDWFPPAHPSFGDDIPEVPYRRFCARHAVVSYIHVHVLEKVSGVPQIYQCLNMLNTLAPQKGFRQREHGISLRILIRLTAREAKISEPRSARELMAAWDRVMEREEVARGGSFLDRLSALHP